MKQWYRTIAMIALLAVFAMPLTMEAEAAATTRIRLTSKTTLRYIIQNVYSGKFLEVADGSLVSGTNVWQDTFNFDTNQAQVFRLLLAKSEDLPGGDGGVTHYQLAPIKNGNLRLDVESAADVDGANIKVFQVNHGYGAQSFAIISNGDGSFRIRPHLSSDSGRVLTVVDSSTANKANVVLSSWTGSSSQKWVFKEIHPTQDPELIALNWSYFFRGDASLPNRRISQRVLMTAEDADDRHQGIDLPAPQGTPIYSPCAGTVVECGSDSSRGNYVTIQSTATIEVNGEQKNLTIRLMHMNGTPAVTWNQTVTKDTLLGYVGSTGDSTGYHLHIDININSYTSGGDIRNNPQYVINPEKLFLSKRFKYGTVESTATFATAEVFYPEWSKVV